jgi:hypothetical protein
VSPGAVAASQVPVLAWLRAGYPELFDREHLPSESGSTTSAFRSGSSALAGPSARVRSRTWPSSPCVQGCDFGDPRDPSGGPRPVRLPGQAPNPWARVVGQASANADRVRRRRRP